MCIPVQCSGVQMQSLPHGLVRVQVGEAARKVHVEPFVPRQGVKIETDPKATDVNNATAMGDDEAVIEALIKRLQVWHPPHAFQMPVSESRPGVP